MCNNKLFEFGLSPKVVYSFYQLRNNVVYDILQMCSKLNSKTKQKCFGLRGGVSKKGWACKPNGAVNPGSQYWLSISS